ncbi:MAG: DUF4173 domain-containing protein [Solirubrobacterales bacterium]
MEKLATGPLKAKSASLAVVLAFAVGVSIDRLAIGQRIGLGFATALLVFVAGTWKMSARSRPETVVLLVAAATLVSWSLFRTAGYLIAIDAIAAAALVVFAVTAWAFDPRVWLVPAAGHLKSAVDQLAALVVGAALPVGVLARSRSRIQLGRALPYARGALFAVPVFGVFAVLLASADVAFSGFMTGLVPDLNISLSSALGHLVLIALLAWLTAGYFAFAWTPQHKVSIEGPQRPRVDRFVEVMVVLSSVAALFALFVAFQFAYLFRDSHEVIAGTTTYSEYARQGFFQLLAVSVLTGVLVWVSMLWLRPLTGRRRALFRAVCSAMILLTGVILASALKRLGLYEEAYGYTRLRVLSHAFTYLVGGLLVVLLAQVYVQRDGLMPMAAIALGFVVLFGLNLINPDAWIAAKNIEIARDRDRSTAIAYTRQLSEDAVPTVLERGRSLPPGDRRSLIAWACSVVGGARDLREWNLGGVRAASAVADTGAARFVPSCSGSSNR